MGKKFQSCVFISKNNCIEGKLNKMHEIFSRFDILGTLWQYGLWSFQTGGTKLERFLPKNQHTQRKLLNFENWVNGEVSKSAKIFYVKNYQNRSQSFFH